MGATEEQMALMSAADVTHVAYVLVIYSLAFLLFLFVNVLLHIYAAYTWPVATPTSAAKNEDVGGRARVNGLGLGSGGVNGHARTPSERLVRDAEEFELEGLMSEPEDEGDVVGAKRS